MDLSVETKSSSSQLLLLLLQQCGDVEPNPGPPRVPRAGRGEPKPDKNAIMQEKVETHDGKIAELEKLAEEQRKTIEEMRAKQVDLEKSLEEAKVDSERRAEAAKVESEEALRAAKVESDRAAAEAKVEAEKRAERIEVEAARGIEAARVESRALVDRAKVHTTQNTTWTLNKERDKRGPDYDIQFRPYSLVLFFGIEALEIALDKGSVMVTVQNST